MSRNKKNLDYKSAALPCAEMEWHESGVPWSKKFQDVYYSYYGTVSNLSEGGSTEMEGQSEFVFLAGNGLPERFRMRRSFAVGELGFGAGLNFLATCKAWRDAKLSGDVDADARLHYLAFEANPLSLEDLRQIHLNVPSLCESCRSERSSGDGGSKPGALEFSKLLLERYPLPLVGLHRLHFHEWRISLTLALGLAESLLNQISVGGADVSGGIDAWYLDGFSPAVNPELWSAETFRKIVGISSADATVATYSSAGAVRRALEENGIVVKKQLGFSGKKHMVVGSRARTDVLPPRRGMPSARESKVAVIGAGIAGAAAAYAFAMRGAEVTVFDAIGVASGGSGNVSGALMPHLSVQPDLRMRFSLLAFAYVTRLLAHLGKSSNCKFYDQCGAIRLLTNQRLRRLYDVLANLSLPRALVQQVGSVEIVALSGLNFEGDGLFYPQGVLVSPPDFCRELLAAYPERISLRIPEYVSGLQRDENGGGRGQWKVCSTSGVFSFDQVVIAGASESLRFQQSSFLPLEKVRGEVAYLKGYGKLADLKTVVCYDGYVLPQIGGITLLGSSYEHGDFLDDVSGFRKEGPSAVGEMVRRLKKHLPACDSDLPDFTDTDDFTEKTATEKTESQESLAYARAAFRASTPDRMPIVGQIPCPQLFERDYQPVRYSSYVVNYQADYWQTGLFVSVGHGSQGLLSAAISGELIAAQAFDEILPLDKELVDALSAVRFLVRAINCRT